MAKFTRLGSREQSFSSALLKQMYLLCANNELCDMVLIAAVDGQRYSCNRSVVGRASNFFRTMSMTPISEFQQKEIVLKGVSGEQLKLLLDFTYTGEVNIEEDENNTAVKKLMCTALKLEFNNAVSTCVDYMEARLTPANCLDILEFAELNSFPKLRDITEAYTLENFRDVCQLDDFLETPFEQLVFLFAKDKLNLPTEEMVFYIIKCWVQHDAPSRRKHLPRLLELVRLPLIQPLSLIDEIYDPWLEENCAEWYYHLVSWKTELSAQQTKKPSTNDTLENKQQNL